jgi:hypothetical protein
MLTEAYRLGRIPKNPFTVVRPLGTDPRERGVLTVEEVQRLFAEENLEPAWKGHLLYRCINLVAACTGSSWPSGIPPTTRAFRLAGAGARARNHRAIPARRICPL